MWSSASSAITRGIFRGRSCVKRIRCRSDWDKCLESTTVRGSLCEHATFADLRRKLTESSHYWWPEIGPMGDHALIRICATDGSPGSGADFGLGFHDDVWVNGGDFVPTTMSPCRPRLLGRDGSPFLRRSGAWLFHGLPTGGRTSRSPLRRPPGISMIDRHAVEDALADALGRTVHSQVDVPTVPAEHGWRCAQLDHNGVAWPSTCFVPAASCISRWSGRRSPIACPWLPACRRPLIPRRFWKAKRSMLHRVRCDQRSRSSRPNRTGRGLCRLWLRAAMSVFVPCSRHSVLTSVDTNGVPARSTAAARS